MKARGERLRRRISAVPVAALPPLAELHAHGPLLIAEMFDAAEQEHHGQQGRYRLRADELATTVSLNTENWRWHTLLGCAFGRSVVSLWAWRFDVPIHDAVLDLCSVIAARVPVTSRRDAA
jgi:hypothetical protein